jgi:glucokinase
MSPAAIFARPVLCVDIGGTSTKAGVLATSGDLKFVDSIPSRPDAERYLSELLNLIRQTRNKAGEQLVPPPVEMGIALAGFLDDGRARLVYNPNLSWLEDFPLRDRLAGAFPDLQLEIEVDSNAAAMAEYRLGSGQGFRRFLCVTSGPGLGVGMVVHGHPLRVAYGCLGDIGHVVVDRDGPLCTCGGRGCAEIMVSAPVLAEQYGKLVNLNQATLRTVIDAAEAGDRQAVQILNHAGEWLGIALASMANTFFPDHIALAGGLSAAGNLVLQPAERTFQKHAAIAARSRAQMVTATLGPRASLIGAASPFWN